MSNANHRALKKARSDKQEVQEVVEEKKVVEKKPVKRARKAIKKPAATKK